MESWKGVLGGEGCYEVSDLGRVRNLKTGKILKPNIGKDGYARVTLYNCPAKAGTYAIHILELEAFRGPAPPGHECDHGGLSRSDNRLEVLEWVTRAVNIQRMIARGGRVSRLRTESTEKPGRPKDWIALSTHIRRPA
jgi:hypothetical protein